MNFDNVPNRLYFRPIANRHHVDLKTNKKKISLSLSLFEREMKGQVSTMFQAFYCMSLTQFGKSMRILCSNNRGFRRSGFVEV